MITNPEDIVIILADVVCRDPECENFDIVIRASISWPDYAVQCGGCSGQITDVVPDEP